MSALLSIAIGAATTLAIYGYQFGRGNHGVYLLDALRLANPALLQRDWFTTTTLQYHILFSAMSALLMKLGIIQPVFLLMYVALAVALHVAWRGIVFSLGGDDVAYLISVVCYACSAAGTGLGMYQFLQDSCLLPSNIANVALLWAIRMWLARRPVWAAAMIGIAGVWHLNFALIGSGLWIVLILWPPIVMPRRTMLIGSALALIPSALNVAYAAQSKLTRSGAMALDQFVDLYVRLRHPHHYDPSTWPIGIWIAFGWTLVAAMLLLRGEARRIVLVFTGLILVALLGAGAWYVSETLVQMSLYRFSIYIQILGCSAAGAWLSRRVVTPKTWTMLAGAVCGIMIVACAWREPFFGFFRMPRDDAAYVTLCRWAAENTPVDAVFVVPPDEESMRLIGERAIVVNYKCVPQLSGELVGWEQRLCLLLGLQRLQDLPHGYTRTLPAIRQQYDQRSADDLLRAAAEYEASYIVVTHPLQDDRLKLVYSDAQQRYMVYDLKR
jgi:hypothetical protein